MFKILGENPIFHQWDLDQKLIVEDGSVNEVHFTNGTADYALVCVVYEQDGLRIVDVPNILLQKSLNIAAYAYCTNYTKQSVVFKVIARSKPADYIYTETEVKSLEKLEKDIEAVENRVTALEENSGGSVTVTVDQTFNALSENAQSGKAVAEAITLAVGNLEPLLRSI